MKPLMDYHAVGDEKVTAMDYSDSGKEMVLSGVYKGQSDLYLYYTGPNSQKQLTNDVYDDLEPRLFRHTNKLIYDLVINS